MPDAVGVENERGLRGFPSLASRPLAHACCVRGCLRGCSVAGRRGRLRTAGDSIGFNKRGNVLIADQLNNRVIDVDRSHRIVWSFGNGSYIPWPRNTPPAQPRPRTCARPCTPPPPHLHVDVPTQEPKASLPGSRRWGMVQSGSCRSGRLSRPRKTALAVLGSR